MPDPDTDTVCDVIRRWAEAQPDAPVFVEEDRAPLDYHGLVGVMDHVRDTLWAAGLGLGDRIGVVLSNSADQAAGLIGVTGFAGAVPLDPNLTSDEAMDDLRSRGVTALIAEAGLAASPADAAGRLGLPILYFEPAGNVRAGGIRFSHAVGAVSATPSPRRAAGPDDIHMVYTTSGTTVGKRVILSYHRRRMVQSSSGAKLFQLSPEDRHLLLRPLYYAGGIGKIFAPLMSGGSIAFAGGFDPETFFRCLTALKPTWYGAGPTIQRAIHAYLMQHPDAARGANLRFIRASSGFLEAHIAEELERKLGAPVIESYASTEVGGHITVNPLPPGRRKRGTVGKATNCEVAIVSPDGDVLAPGQRGEIIVKRCGVTDLHRHDLGTGDGLPPGGWLRTGDEGFLDGDGYLTLTGRLKEMINRGGTKVSPSEVDAALMSHPEVREAASFPVPHPTLGEEVAAAVVAEPGTGPTAVGLGKYLMERLSGYKLPRRYVFVDAIPKNNAGKVQRYRLAKALGMDCAAGPGDEAGTAQPGTPLQARLQEIWQRVLKRDSVGLHDDFFMLGGDSVQAVDLFLEVERALACRLPVAALFEASTVAEMARLIEEENAPDCVVPIQPRGSKPPFFCVHGNGGEIIGFHPLAKRLGMDQPFYGIQAVGWDGKIAPFTRSEDMAAHYVAEMRKIQPEGPYYFGGYSFGGRVAIYMARRLAAEGQKVGLLALLDPSSYAGRNLAGFEIWRARWDHPRGLRLLWCAADFAWFRARRAYDFAYTLMRRAVLFPIWQHHRRTGKPVPPGLRRPGRANKLMRIEHRRMPAYDGDAVYFAAERRPTTKGHPDSRATWNRLVTGRLETVAVLGAHDQIIREPYVASLAQGLDRALDRAIAEARAAQSRPPFGKGQVAE